MAYRAVGSSTASLPTNSILISVLPTSFLKSVWGGRGGIAPLPQDVPSLSLFSLQCTCAKASHISYGIVSTVSKSPAKTLGSRLHRATKTRSSHTCKVKDNCMIEPRSTHTFPIKIATTLSSTITMLPQRLWPWVYGMVWLMVIYNQS